MRLGKPKEDKDREKAAQRLRTVSDYEVLNWADQAFTSAYRCLDAYRRDKDPAAISEARQTVSMLAGAIDVLESRIS